QIVHLIGFQNGDEEVYALTLRNNKTKTLFRTELVDRSFDHSALR
mgnify:CR=1